MGVFIKNANTSVGLTLTALKLVGFWAPDSLRGNKKQIYKCYTVFSFMSMLGYLVITHVIELFFNWGDLPLMTGTASVLFTNLAHATKVFIILSRKQVIQEIISDADRILTNVQGEEAKEIVKRCNRETNLQSLIFFSLYLITLTGWSLSPEKNQLPFRAWCPYDTSKSPAFELTYIQQVTTLFTVAFLNYGKDMLVVALIAQCKCRLQLLSLALRKLSEDLPISKNKQMLTAEQEHLVKHRLRDCVREHQMVLDAVKQLQDCFSVPIFVQFTVSLIIICSIAFQMALQTGNTVRFLSMGLYLASMCYEIFVYCYQGTQLSDESLQVSGAAYQCGWYSWSLGLRRSLIVLMERTRRESIITAGGLTALSLATFMAIIKASYSLFTVLQQVEYKN